MYSFPGTSSAPSCITTGPDGNLWFTESGGSKIGKISLKTGSVTEYVVPTANGQLGKIVTGPDGNLWFIEDSEGIGKISPETGFITEYNVPDVEASWNGITAGPDGNLWFVDGGPGEIDNISPATGVIHRYRLP